MHRCNDLGMMQMFSQALVFALSPITQAAIRPTLREAVTRWECDLQGFWAVWKYVASSV